MDLAYCGPLICIPRENQYVLVMTDYFIQHVTAIALLDCSANTTAQALFTDFFCKYEVPSVIKAPISEISSWKISQYF